MVKKLYWEYFLYNAEISRSLNVDKFNISHLENYKDRIKELKNKSANDISIETVKAKTLTPLSEEDADKRIINLMILLSFAQGRTVTYYRKISYPEHGKVNEIQTGTFFGKSCGSKIIRDNELENFLQSGFSQLDSSKEKDTISQSLYWYNLGFEGNSIQEYFIKRWIALEIFVEKYSQELGFKKIAPKNKFPKEELKESILKILKSRNYTEKQIELSLEQVESNLNRINFFRKAQKFFVGDIQLPLFKKNISKFKQLYETRNNIFHKGFGTKSGTKEWDHAVLLEKIVQRIILAKLIFKNDYFYGDFWSNPYVYVIGKKPK